MITIDSYIISTGQLDSLTNFLVNVFEMEVVEQSQEAVELQLSGVHIRLIPTSTPTSSSVAKVLFRSSSLDEISELMQRVEFFYFANDITAPSVTIENHIDSEQLASVFAPDGSRWDIFYLN